MSRQTCDLVKQFKPQLFKVKIPITLGDRKWIQRNRTTRECTIDTVKQKLSNTNVVLSLTKNVVTYCIPQIPPDWGCLSCSRNFPTATSVFEVTYIHPRSYPSPIIITNFLVQTLLPYRIRCSTRYFNVQGLVSSALLF